ncbi:AcaB family transcriptional regulator [Stenoxybacter acetivorans]|uniref:AcaB family transcriptional regulator n=1 Tax=Stenoxybacter acetivorans TaxID=422441 RepID=UPI00055D763E|nr:AcaB family transcriptional regulator [Stenoxybacter acetivorans]
MIEMKRTFVVPPAALKMLSVTKINYTDYVFEKSDTSPFDNQYDLAREEAKLGEKLNIELADDHPDYAAKQLYLAHENALIQHLKRSFKRLEFVRGEYRIVPDDFARFDIVGNLVEETADKLVIHTKQALRMWEGQSDPSKKRWIGLRMGIFLIDELTRNARLDNPFALSYLLQVEQQLKAVAAEYQNMIQQVYGELDKLATNGIQVSLLENREPVVITASQTRLYGFKLLTLLTQYDLYVRALMTGQAKGLTDNKQTRNLQHIGDNMLRGLLVELFQTVTTMRSLPKRFIRKQLLDEGLLLKLSKAVKAGALPRLDEQILRYNRLPELLYVPNKLTEEEVNQVVDKARQAGLLNEVETDGATGELSELVGKDEEGM